MMCHEEVSLSSWPENQETVHETPTKMYVLTVVHGSRNDILLRIRPRHEESPICVWPIIT